MSATSLRTYLQDNKSFVTACSLIKHERFREALDLFKDLLTINERFLPDILNFLYREYAQKPTDYGLGILISELHWITKSPEDAFWELAEIVEQDPGYSPAYSMLGKLYKRSELKKEVRAVFEHSFSQGIYESQILDLLPTIYLEEGNYDQGILFYETLIRLKPEVLHLRKNLAGFYAQVGRYVEAVRLYEEIVASSPSCLAQAAEFCESIALKAPQVPEIHEVLVALHTKSCNPTGALNHLKLMVEIQPEFIPQAVQACKSLLALYPDTVDVLLELARFLIHLDRFSEGVACLKQIFHHGRESEDMVALLALVLEKYPMQLMALHLKAELQFRRRDYAQVLVLIEQILSVSESDMDFFQLEQLLTNVMLQDSVWAPRARLLFAKALLLHGDYVRADLECRRLWGGQLDEDARALAVGALRGMGRDPEAFRLAFQTLQKYPYQAELHRHLKELHRSRAAHRMDRLMSDEGKNVIALGLFKLQNLDFVSAMGYFQKIEVGHKDYFCAQLLLNHCFFETGRYDLSVSQLSRLLSDSTLTSSVANQIRFFLGVSYVHMGLIHDALKYFESILEFDVAFPHLDGVISQLKSEGMTEFRARLLASIGWPEADGLSFISVFPFESEHVLNSEHQSTVGFSHTHNNQGVEHFIKGHDKAARDAFDMAVHLDPEFWVGHLNLGTLYLKQGDLALAKQSFEAVIESSPSLDIAHLNLGVVLWKQGHSEQAFACFTRANSINPHREVTQLILGDYFAASGQYRDAFSFWETASKSVWMFFYIQRRLWYLCPPELSASEWTSVLHRSPLDYLKLGSQYQN